MEHPHRAVLPHDPVVVDEGARRPEGVEDHAARVLAVVGVDALEEALVRGVELVPLEAVDPVELVAPGDDVPRRVPLPAPDVRDPLGLGEPVLGTHELLHARGHVEREERAPRAAGSGRGIGPRRERSASRRHGRLCGAPEERLADEPEELGLLPEDERGELPGRVARVDPERGPVTGSVRDGPGTVHVENDERSSDEPERLGSDHGSAPGGGRIRSRRGPVRKGETTPADGTVSTDRRRRSSSSTRRTAPDPRRPGPSARAVRAVPRRAGSGR